MDSKMSKSFRTPESYNILLYAMANGYNRISESAAYSGYPKNKCDKYIKALCEVGLVRKEPERNGHTKYYPQTVILRCGIKYCSPPFPIQTALSAKMFTIVL